jgi:hypothetical protein
MRDYFFSEFKNLKKISLIFLLTFINTIGFAFADLKYSLKEIEKLRNDKEARSEFVKEKEASKLLSIYNEKQREQLKNSFYEAFLDFANYTPWKCELALFKTFTAQLQKEKLLTDERSISEYLKVLRASHAIDDILYSILVSLKDDHFGFQKLNFDRHGSIVTFKNKKLVKNNPLKDLFSSFEVWPDEEKSCVYQEYVNLRKSIKNSKNKISDKSSHFEALVEKALQKEIISLQTYNGLKYLNKKSNVNKRTIWIEDYFAIVLNAKNNMIPHNRPLPPKVIEKQDPFSTKRVRRLSRLTRRTLLYQKYSETQIILLAQVLQKASKRMGVDPDTKTLPPVITQEFRKINEKGEEETYVETIEIDTQSQYNLARRLMRKDMTELQMMDIFSRTIITYEDVIMAAFETGYISFEDIEYAIRYDDLWNPEISRQEKVIGFVRSVLGYATFLLPPPWNVTTSIVLGIAEGLVSKQFVNGAENDNPSTFIE